MPFEDFQRPPRRRPAYPGLRVTLYHGGSFRLNGPAFDALGRPSRVVPLIDPRERVAAFRPAEGADDYALRAVAQGAHGGAIVSAVAFCSHYGIGSALSPRHFPARIEGGLLQFALG